MRKNLQSLLFLSSLLMLICWSVFADEQKNSFGKEIILPETITNLLTQQYPGWELISEKDINNDDKICLENNEYKGKFVGDFNNDNKFDYVIQLKYNNKYLTLVFISQSTNYKQYTLGQTQVTELDKALTSIISVAKKGDKYYDFDKEKHRIYPSDAIISYYCERGGSAYIFSKGHFQEVIVSD